MIKCNKCGAEYEDYAEYCNMCDIFLVEEKSIKTPKEVVEQSISITLGILESQIWVYAVLLVIGAITGFYFLDGLNTINDEVRNAWFGIFAIIILAFSLILLLFLILSFIAIIGLKRRKSWARTLAIFIGVSETILLFPIGAFFGISIIVQMFKKAWKNA